MELFVPKIIDQLSDVVFNEVGERVKLAMGVEEKVANLSLQLIRIEKVLHDAESRRLREKDVGFWLEKLEDITYEMEDLLEEWNIKICKPTNALNHGNDDQNGGKLQNLLRKVRSFRSSACSCIKQVPVRSDFAVKIKEISDKLEMTLKEANQFNFLTTNIVSRHAYSNEFKRPKTTSVVNELEVHGREIEKQSLLLCLLPAEQNASHHNFVGQRDKCLKDISKLGGESGKNGFKVISIVGLGGIGKTTLAQALYNHDEVKRHFELRKWICVSDTFDEIRIAKALIETPKESYSNVSELETLIQPIKEYYSGKKFLLVLDDVWTEDDSKWKTFRDSLTDCAAGSIIMVTTRSERVARAIGTNYKHSLGILPDFDCWLILKKIALMSAEKVEFSKRVEKIGLKIAEKCKGLPLAAKIMGSLLQFKDSVQEWQEVLDSEIWQLEEAAVELFPHFYLSYNELSPQLKRCFSYCVVFPKDTDINVDQLIRLWMAQGYLGKSRGDEMLEMTGRRYFNNLVMRSFFQELENEYPDESRVFSCKMHDIVHDFAQFLMKNECATIDETGCRKAEAIINSGAFSFKKSAARHLTLNGCRMRTISSSIPEIGKARSLFVLNDDEVPQDLFVSLKCVRVLALKFGRNRELIVPQQIGNLIHLRFLDLSGNLFEELQETICHLYYLETLDITECNRLRCLPQRIGDLVNLRHFRNYGTSIRMPAGFENLTSIHTLITFRVGGEYNDISMLKYLNQLEEIQIIVHGNNNVDFRNAQLGKKTCMRVLGLEFEVEGRDDLEEVISSIELMEPPPKLEILNLWNYPGSQFPEWIVSEPVVNSLRILSIHSARGVSSWPALEKLSSLEFLQIWTNISTLDHLGFLTQMLHDETNHHGTVVPIFLSLKSLRIISKVGGGQIELTRDGPLQGKAGPMMSRMMELIPSLQLVNIPYGLL